MIASIRSAEAFGITELFLIGDIDINTWKVNHISKGTIKHIKITKFKDSEQCINYLIKNKINIVVVENTSDSDLITNYEFKSDIAIVMGNECIGVPREFLNYDIVKIPQYGLCKCLNTTVAVSIVMYERFKQSLKI